MVCNATAPCISSCSSRSLGGRGASRRRGPRIAPSMATARPVGPPPGMMPYGREDPDAKTFGFAPVSPSKPGQGRGAGRGVWAAGVLQGGRLAEVCMRDRQQACGGPRCTMAATHPGGICSADARATYIVLGDIVVRGLMVAPQSDMLGHTRQRQMADARACSFSTRLCS